MNAQPVSNRRLRLLSGVLASGLREDIAAAFLQTLRNEKPQPHTCRSVAIIDRKPRLHRLVECVAVTACRLAVLSLQKGNAKYLCVVPMILEGNPTLFNGSLLLGSSPPKE